MNREPRMVSADGTWRVTLKSYSTGLSFQVEQASPGGWLYVGDAIAIEAVATLVPAAQFATLQEERSA